MPHYQLPLAARSVGTAGCSTTCAFARPAFPGEPVLEPRYFRASASPLSPTERSTDDEEARLAWIDLLRPEQAGRPRGPSLFRRKPAVIRARPQILAPSCTQRRTTRSEIRNPSLPQQTKSPGGEPTGACPVLGRFAAGAFRSLIGRLSPSRARSRTSMPRNGPSRARSRRTGSRRGSSAAHFPAIAGSTVACVVSAWAAESITGDASVKHQFRKHSSRRPPPQFQ